MSIKASFFLDSGCRRVQSRSFIYIFKGILFRSIETNHNVDHFDYQLAEARYVRGPTSLAPSIFGEACLYHVAMCEPIIALNLYSPPDKDKRRRLAVQREDVGQDWKIKPPRK